jgi:hypothetical protein
VQRSQQHAGNAGHIPRLGRQTRQERHQLDLAHPFAQVVLTCRDGVPAAVARQPRHDILGLECGDHVAPRRVLAGEKNPDLHDISTMISPWLDRLLGPMRS